MTRLFAKSLLTLVFLAVWPSVNAFSAGAWDMDLPLPPDSPQWQEVQSLWSLHWDGKNLDALIGRLHQIETGGENPLAVNIWLSQAYYLKARHEKKGRVDNLKKSEQYANAAIALDPGNMTAMKLLIISVSSYADMDYIRETYGPLFSAHLPVPVGRALPVLDTVPEFTEAIACWDRREDIEQGKKAVTAFTKIANERPDDLIAQLWVCRGNYYLGYYYLSLGEDETALPFFQEGDAYGLKALALDPHNVPANYWRQLNLARSIQNANILTKARYLHTIMNHLVLTANENATYFYCGPLISTATIIEKGGWLAERGLGLAGYSIDTVAMGLELAVRAYPTYFYIYFAKAEVLHHMGQRDEAATLLHQILEMDPRQNPYHAPENLCVQRLSRAYLAEHFREK